MSKITARHFTANRSWGALRLLEFDRHAASLHWTDTAYRWHVNTGDELFVVLDGEVDLCLRQGQSVVTEHLSAGELMVIPEGQEHVAKPRGEARILVVEQRDSE